MKYKFIKTLLTSCCVIIFWLVWLPYALVKDAVQLIYIPFDTQRMLDSFIATVRNAQQLVEVWVPLTPINHQPLPKSQRQIGFLSTRVDPD